MRLSLPPLTLATCTTLLSREVSVQVEGRGRIDDARQSYGASRYLGAIIVGSNLP